MATAGVTHARPPHRPGARSCAILLTAVVTATDQHLGPAADTQEQAPCSLQLRDGRYTARHTICRLLITQTVDGLGTGAAPASLCKVTTTPRLCSVPRTLLLVKARRCATGESSAPHLDYRPIVKQQRLPSFRTFGPALQRDLAQGEKRFA